MEAKVYKYFTYELQHKHHSFSSNIEKPVGFWKWIFARDQTKNVQATDRLESVKCD